MGKYSFIFITCAPGIAPYLDQEVRSLGYDDISVSPKGVRLSGTISDCMKLNLYLRTANRVLFQACEFNVSGAIELYNAAIEFPWEDFIPLHGYFFIDSFVRNDTIRDTRFANLKLKDAIADRILKVRGKRPDSGPLREKTCLFMYWIENACTIYFDTSGETIAKHGYRKIPGEAPMQETLAAAVIRATNWDLTQPFINPMCGSGTIAIEAALMAKNKYPALSRVNFGFMHLLGYNQLEWSSLKSQALDSESDKSMVIEASDISKTAVDQAETNAKMAGVGRQISFSVSDFKELNPPPAPGIIILNPEYGERLGNIKLLESTYSEAGDFLKTKCSGYKGYIFTGNRELAKHIGLKTKRKIEFYNGKIDCRLLEYELYKGSKKLIYP